MQSVFTQFYCLPIRDILILMAVATWCFLRLRQQFRDRLPWKILHGAAFLAFTAVILYLTVTTRESASGSGLFLVPFHSYREVMAGGNPEILRSNFMNAVLFYPSGLLMAALLPQRWPRWCRVLPVLLLFAGVSAGVEYIQFTRGMGMAEIDDVLHNSLGALLGSLCSLIPLPEPQPVTLQDTPPYPESGGPR